MQILLMDRNKDYELGVDLSCLLKGVRRIESAGERRYIYITVKKGSATNEALRRDIIHQEPPFHNIESINERT